MSSPGGIPTPDLAIATAVAVGDSLLLNQSGYTKQIDFSDFKLSIFASPVFTGSIALGTTIAGFLLTSGYDYFYSNVAGTNPNSGQGLAFGWNGSGGNAEGNIINAYSTGATYNPIWLQGWNGTAVKTYVVAGAAALTPGTDNTASCGASSLRWSQVYAGTGTINTSGAETKTNVRALNDAEIAVAKALASNVRVYQFCDAVAKKGEDVARLHIGAIFEDVTAAFAGQSLDPRRYGIVCEDPVFKAVPAEDGLSQTHEPDLDESGTQKMIVGLRYSELSQFILAGLNARLAILEAAA